MASAPGLAAAQDADLSGLSNTYLLTPEQAAASAPAGTDTTLRTALDAASEPKPAGSAFNLEFAGRVTMGINSKSGPFGGAAISARQNNIGGSNISAGVYLSQGFD